MIDDVVVYSLDVLRERFVFSGQEYAGMPIVRVGSQVVCFEPLKDGLYMLHPAFNDLYRQGIKEMERE